jgi:hypothetical protein
VTSIHTLRDLGTSCGFSVAVEWGWLRKVMNITKSSLPHWHAQLAASGRKKSDRLRDIEKKTWTSIYSIEAGFRSRDCANLRVPFLLPSPANRLC